MSFYNQMNGSQALDQEVFWHLSSVETSQSSDDQMKDPLMMSNDLVRFNTKMVVRLFLLLSWSAPLSIDGEDE